MSYQNNIPDECEGITFFIPIPEVIKDGPEEDTYMRTVMKAYLRTSEACKLYDLCQLGKMDPALWVILNQDRLDTFAAKHWREFV